MVSFNVYRSTYSGAYVEGICLATDEKPVVGIANGSILFAVDASNGETTRYMYDKESMSWIEAECPCSGGSGSGSGGSGGGVEPLIVNFVSPGNAGPAWGDKTLGEIFDAASAGRLVVGKLETSGDGTFLFSLLSASIVDGYYNVCFEGRGTESVELFPSLGEASDYPSLPRLPQE